MLSLREKNSAKYCDHWDKNFIKYCYPLEKKNSVKYSYHWEKKKLSNIAITDKKPISNIGITKKKNSVKYCFDWQKNWYQILLSLRKKQYQILPSLRKKQTVSDNTKKPKVNQILIFWTFTYFLSCSSKDLVPCLACLIFLKSSW